MRKGKRTDAGRKRHWQEARGPTKKANGESSPTAHSQTTPKSLGRGTKALQGASNVLSLRGQQPHTTGTPPHGPPHIKSLCHWARQSPA